MLIVLLPEISAPLTCSLSSQASDRYLSWGQRCLWAAKQTGFCSQTPGASLRQAKGKKLWTCLLFYAAQYRPLDAIHNRGLLWRKGGGDACTQDIWRLEVCWSQTCYSTEEHAAGRAWWLRLAVVLIVRCELSDMLQHRGACGWQGLVAEADCGPDRKMWAKQHGRGRMELPDYQRTGGLMSMRSICCPYHSPNDIRLQPVFSLDLESGPWATRHFFWGSAPPKSQEMIS